MIGSYTLRSAGTDGARPSFHWWLSIRIMPAMKSAAALAFASLVALFAPQTARAQAVPDSVYPPPEPSRNDLPRDQQPGFRFALEARYLTDYVWRGLERFDAGRPEDTANYQIEPKISFDLGKLPHPYVSVFVNLAENDPISNFQEVRPEAGFDWLIRPLTLSGGYTSYIFPDRTGIDTAEIFARLSLDDSTIFHSERPVFHPYISAAYDFDVWEGLYLEVGIQHEIPIENTGLVFIANANVGYVNGFDLFRSADAKDDNTSGFQHWEVGVTAKYTLNQLLNVPIERFGRISILGYINYTDSIDRQLEATNQFWGGAGFSLEF